jgi:hypothetical protein
MKENASDNTKEKGHDVETPPPPQVIDPSAPPDQVVPKQGEKSRDSSSPKRNKKGKNQEDKKLTPNEEL